MYHVTFSRELKNRTLSKGNNFIYRSVKSPVCYILPYFKKMTSRHSIYSQSMSYTLYSIDNITSLTLILTELQQFLQACCIHQHTTNHVTCIYIYIQTFCHYDHDYQTIMTMLICISILTT